MLKWSTMIGFAALLAPATILAQGYDTKEGDYMWVIVRDFPARNYAKARDHYMKKIWAKLAGDGITRDHILAEDAKRHRLAVVVFANVKKQVHGKAAGELDRMATRKRSDWYRIAMINDEPYEPKIGDTLVIYENHYPKARHESARKPQERLMAAMKHDGVDKDSFVTEKPGTGHWGGIALGRARDRSRLSYPQWNRQIAKHRTSRRVETFRIIGLQDE
jgi:hypothetical protein